MNKWKNKLMHKNLNKEKTHHTLLLLQSNASIHLLIFLYLLSLKSSIKQSLVILVICPYNLIAL